MNYKSSIELRNMHFFSYHGVSSQEKKVGNNFNVNLEIEADLSSAIESDRIEDTISYYDLYKIVENEMKIPSNLIEQVAGRIIKSVGNKYPKIKWIKISISKINPPLGGDVEAATIQIIAGSSA